MYKILLKAKKLKLLYFYKLNQNYQEIMLDSIIILLLNNSEKNKKWIVDGDIKNNALGNCKLLYHKKYWT